MSTDLNIDHLAAALQAAHAVTGYSLTPNVDYRVLAREVARNYETTVNTAARAAATGLETASMRPIGYLVDVLKQAYSDPGRASLVLAQVGIDTSALNFGQSPARFWTDALVFARDLGKIDAIVAKVCADSSVRGFHERIRAAAAMT